MIIHFSCELFTRPNITNNKFRIVSKNFLDVVIGLDWYYYSDWSVFPASIMGTIASSGKNNDELIDNLIKSDSVKNELVEQTMR